MDQPHNRNALSAGLRAPAWLTGWHAAIADRAVRAVVLTHTGPVFCAGADISESGGAPTAEDPRIGLAGILTRHPGLTQTGRGPHRRPLPGGGVGLAAACDLSVASEEAMFGFTEVRIGVAPAIVSVVTVPKLRVADALELFLTGERIPAATSRRRGPDHLRRAGARTSTLRRAGWSLSCWPADRPALATAKRLIFEIPAMERADAFQWTTELSESLFASAEAAEGMAAFREKRRPSWHPSASRGIRRKA